MHLRHTKNASLLAMHFADYQVIRLGFEPKTHSLEGCCSIQLSYRTDPCTLAVALLEVSAGVPAKGGQRKVGAKVVFFFGFAIHGSV